MLTPFKPKMHLIASEIIYKETVQSGLGNFEKIIYKPLTARIGLHLP